MMNHHNIRQQNNIECIFNRANLRITRHRKLAFTLLAQSKEPLTAESLFIQMRENDSSVSLSTVYRIIDVFLEKGLADRASLMDEGRALYEVADGSHHHHLRCLGCNHTLVVEGCPLEEYERMLEKTTRFRVTGHRLELTGYCSECMEQMDTRK